MKGWRSAVLLILVATGSVWATVPTRMNYQGKLLDKSNNPRNGSYSMTFSIWDDGPTVGSGNMLWSGTQQVTVVNGVFFVQLGAATPLPPSIFEDDRTYLQIEIDSEVAASRQRLVTSPYSFRAAMADDLEAGDGDYIHNTESLQSGSTFYVSSGTVQNDLNVQGQIRAGSGGYLITNAAGQLQAINLSGTVPNSSLDSSSATLQGNTFNSPNKLVRLDASGGLTLTSTLTLSGVSTDIVSPAGQDLVLAPGSGAFVGIGITSPEAMFHVLQSGAGSSDKVFVLSTGTTPGTDFLNVYGDGYLIADGPIGSNNFIAQVYNTGTLSLGTSFASIDWDAQSVVDSIYSHDAGGSPSIVTFNRTGLYRVSYHVNMDVPSGNTRSSGEVVALKEGVAITPSTTYTYNRDSADGVDSAVASFLIAMSASDTLEVQARRRTSGSVDVISGSWLLVECLR